MSSVLWYIFMKNYCHSNSEWHALVLMSLLSLVITRQTQSESVHCTTAPGSSRNSGSSRQNFVYNEVAWHWQLSSFRLGETYDWEFIPCFKNVGEQRTSLKEANPRWQTRCKGKMAGTMVAQKHTQKRPNRESGDVNMNVSIGGQGRWEWTIETARKWKEQYQNTNPNEW